MSFLDSVAPPPSVKFTCHNASIGIEVSCTPSNELIAELKQELDRPGFKPLIYGFEDFQEYGKLHPKVPHGWNPKDVATALGKLFEKHGYVTNIELAPSYRFYLLKGKQV